MQTRGLSGKFFPGALVLFFFCHALSAKSCLLTLRDLAENTALTAYIRYDNLLARTNRTLATHPVAVQLLNLTKPVDVLPPKNDSGPSRSLFGVAYQPGHGPFTWLIPPIQRRVVRNNGRFTPLTWTGKDGRRYDFDPIHASYQWWSTRNGGPAREFTLLSRALNVVDGPHVRMLLYSSLLLGGAQAYRSHKDDKELREIREGYPFLQDFSRRAAADGGADDQAQQITAAAIIQDIGKSPDQYQEIKTRFKGVAEDSQGMASVLAVELANVKSDMKAQDLDTTKNPELEPALEVMALKRLYDRRETLPAGVRKSVELTMMIFANPSLWKVQELFFKDLTSSYKTDGFALRKKSALASAQNDWRDDKPVSLTLTNPQHLTALSAILDDQIDRNYRLGEAHQQYEKSKEPEEIKKAKRDREMASIYYETNANLLLLIGLVPGHFVQNKWQPLTPEELKTLLAQKVNETNK